RHSPRPRARCAAARDQWLLRSPLVTLAERRVPVGGSRAFASAWRDRARACRRAFLSIDGEGGAAPFRHRSRTRVSLHWRLIVRAETRRCVVVPAPPDGMST